MEPNNKKTRTKYSRKQFIKSIGGATLGGGLLSSFGFPFTQQLHAGTTKEKSGQTPWQMADLVERIAADPTDIPPPITRKTPKTHKIELVSKEVLAEIEDGVQFHYMTFGGQVPSPLIRVRQGDTVILTLTSDPENLMLHNVDFHAVYGTGGGADATYVTPGQSQTIKFKAMYPGGVHLPLCGTADGLSYQ